MIGLALRHLRRHWRLNLAMLLCLTLASALLGSVYENVRLVEGRLPVQAGMSEATGNWPPPVEAAMGRGAAEQTGFGVGNRLTASGFYQHLDIVGVVEPLDSEDDLWG